MKKLSVLLSAALLVVAAPVLAGSDKSHAKKSAMASGSTCSATAQACLNHWAEGKDKGWVGIEYDKSEAGVITVKAVTAESPAAAAGFKAGDVLLAMNGAMLSDKEAVKKAKGEWKVGQSVTYTVKRAGAEKQIAVTLGETPENVFAAMVGSHMLMNHVETTTAAASYEKAADKK